MLMWSVLFSLMIFTLLSKSPFKAALTLATVSTMLGVTFSEYMDSWLMCTVIILFVGGMMVLFLYSCSLMTPEKFIFKIQSGEIMLLSVIILLHNHTMGSSQSSCISNLFFMESLVVLSIILVNLLISLGVVLGLSFKLHGTLKLKFI